MILRDVVERFEKKAPVCLMVRATLENVFAAERFDAMFENTAQQQRSGELLFSTHHRRHDGHGRVPDSSVDSRRLSRSGGRNRCDRQVGL